MINFPHWLSDTGRVMHRYWAEITLLQWVFIFLKEKCLFELLQNRNKDATDFGKEIIPASIKDHKVFSFQYDGYWTDIGNISSFFEANLALTKDIPPFNFFDNSKIVYTRSRMLPPAKISGSRMDNTLAADGCIIHAERIETCIIGIRTRIGHGTTVY